MTAFAVLAFITGTLAAAIASALLLLPEPLEGGGDQC